MRRRGTALMVFMLSLCVTTVALVEASRYSRPFHTRLTLLSHGYFSYALGEDPVSIGTRAEGRSDRHFALFNGGQPVYSAGNLVGCITTLGSFIPVGVNDGSQMREPGRRFIVTLTWAEMFALVLGLVLLTALMRSVALADVEKLPRFMSTPLIFLFLLLTLSIALGEYGIAVFKQAEWVPFNPNYQHAMLTFFSAFRVPPTGLLVFWNNCSLLIGLGLAAVLIGTTRLSLHHARWLPVMGAALVCSALFAGCAMWIWQCSMMNWYELPVL